MIHSSPNTIKKELANDLNKDTTYEEIDLEQLEEEFAKKNTNNNKKKNNKKLEQNGIIKPQKRLKTPKISVNQQQSTNQETSGSCGEDDVVSNGDVDEAVVNDVKSEVKKISNISDPGYQANMRFLMQRPKSSLVMNGGLGGYSRPNSASYINGDSKPPSRSTSASSLMGRRSPGILTGPYLTEPLRSSRPSSGMYSASQKI